MEVGKRLDSTLMLGSPAMDRIERTISPRWSPAPPGFGIEAGEVHLWHVALAELPDSAAGALGGPERERAEQILSPLRRRRWTAARAVLRELLGRYLQADPGSVRLTADEHGRPLAAHSRAPQFNLSHSGSNALFAFAHSGGVGVDVQMLGRPSLLGRTSLARRLLGDERADQLSSLPEAARAREFLRAWVRHEAELKCGVGVGWVADLELGAGALGAVACQRPPRELHCWEFRHGNGPGRS
jgi:4'-phosphopantetheinyl transferase